MDRVRWSRTYAASPTPGAPPEAIAEAKHLFDCNTLTLGFARRFATYKRPNLLLHDPERLLRLLSFSFCPVLLIFTGKAHPAATPLGGGRNEWHEGAGQWRHQPVGTGRLGGGSLYAGSGLGAGGWP